MQTIIAYNYILRVSEKIMYRNNLKKLLVICLAIQLVYIYGYDKEAEDTEIADAYTQTDVAEVIIEENPPIKEKGGFESIDELPENPEKNLYMTETGECYHREDCYFLKSKIEVTISDAKISGLRPCTKCNPPELVNYFD